MANAYINRPTVHDWSDKIGEEPAAHQAALARLLKDQRRLGRFIEENRASMQGPTAGVATYLVGVVMRMFDLAGGRLRGATWEQVRDAEARVGAVAASLLPVDAGFADRVRKIEWRAQPHILDEALMALFARPADAKDDEADVAEAEKAKIFFLMWVATEVLDANWTPPASFAGEKSYSYVHFEPKV
jgi:hypothetical protein